LHLLKPTFKIKTVPFALLALVILCFGLLITGMGFYQDDWYLVWMGRHYGPQIYISFFEGSRPLLAAIYMLTTQLIGSSMLAWQIFALLTRWLAVITAWWALRLLWPKHTQEVTWMAVLLAIYPAFKQHFVSVVYSNTYIALIATFFSFGAMLMAIRQPRRFWLWTIASLLAGIFSMVTTEYFFGMELFRPVLLWITFAEAPDPSQQLISRRKRLRLTLIHWAPYLAATAAFLIWRVFFFTSYMYGPKMAEDLAQYPLATVFHILQTLIQDAFESSIFAWLQTFDFSKTLFPDLRTFLITWVIVVASAALVGWYLMHLKTEPEPTSTAPTELPKDHFSTQAIFLGIYSTLIVGWPFWFAGLNVELSGGFDRFTLPYMFGASILIVGLLDWLVKSKQARVALVSILVGAAVLFQIRNAQTYQEAHRVQAALFRDLAWRAPGLKSGANLLINDIPVDYTGNASMNAALNWVYAPDTRGSQANYNLYYLPFKLGSPELPDLNPGLHTANSLVAFYQPPGCVQVLDPQVHQNLPRLTAPIQEAIPLSDLTQIDPQGVIALSNYRKLFGHENQVDWCYYFEKADLARQLGLWSDITRLGDEAFAKDMGPNDKFSTELLPFIEGYARTGRWQDALSLSEITFKDIPALQTSLCETWQRILENTAEGADHTEAVERANNLLKCKIP
jgi:hypothetical protein